MEIKTKIIERYVEVKDLLIWFYKDYKEFKNNINNLIFKICITPFLVFCVPGWLIFGLHDDKKRDL